MTDAMNSDDEDCNVLKTPTCFSSYASKDTTTDGNLSAIQKLLQENDRWTRKSVSLLMPKTILGYDRLKHYIDGIFGCSTSPMLSPLHFVCLEDGCKYPIVTLKRFNSLDRYVKHLESHLATFSIKENSFSELMLKRLKSFEIFSPHLDMDELHPLAPRFAAIVKIADKDKIQIRKLRLERDFSGHYLGTWLNVILAKENSMMSSTHVLYQEIDAMISTAVSFPKPIEDWSIYQTLLLHGLSLFTSTPMMAYELVRGTPQSNSTKKICEANEDRLKHIDNHNHFYPSVVSLWRQLPPISFRPITVQPSYLDAHYCLLESNKSAVFWKSPTNHRYPVQLICDEQPISQTTSLIEQEGCQYLVGLNRPLTMGSVIELGGIDKIPDLLASGSLEYISAVLEFRVVDVTGMHCSNPLTMHLSGKSKGTDFISAVQKAVQLVNTCSSCRSLGISCSFSDGSNSCSNCLSQNNTICKSMKILGVVCDMADDHVSVEKEIEKIVPIVYGIYHIIKAITNTARNNTLILKGSYFSIQVLLCLYAKSAETGTDIGNLPRTAFVSTDRQSDVNSYLMCCKEVRKTLEFTKFLTFQRYPDVYEGPKSFFQVPLEQISQVFVNKNGEIFLVENGKVFGLSHRVLCQKKLIQPPAGLDFGDSSFLDFGITTHTKNVTNRTTGTVTTIQTEHMFTLNCNTNKLYILSHLQKTMTNSGNVSAPLKCMFQFAIKLHQDNLTILFSCSSYNYTKGIFLILDGGLRSIIAYLSSEKLFSPIPKDVDGHAIRSLTPITKCSMHLVIDETLLNCQLHADADSILCLTTERITIFKLNDGTFLRDIKLTQNQWVHILPCGKSNFAVINKNNKIELRSLMNNNVTTLKIEGVSKVYSVTAYQNSVVIAGEDMSNDKTPSIHIFTPLSEAVMFCTAIENLYNCVGYSSGTKTYKPSNCKKTSFEMSSKLASHGLEILANFKNARTSIFDGTLLSNGSIGFISNGTFKCLQKTVGYIVNSKLLFTSAINCENARIDCLINELYVEGFFGSITSTQTGAAADLHDYVFSKRKIEISSTIRNSSKPFKFRPNKNKLYAELNESKVKAWDTLKILKNVPHQPLLDNCDEPKATDASRSFMENLYQRTKGQRCRAPRSNHKKIPMTAPYQIYDAQHKAKRKKTG